MCINIETSIFAFLTGIISGYLLINKNNKIEYRQIGKFIIFYSFVQLFEACIYFYGDNASSIFSQLILINVSFHGLILFLLISKIIDINYYYLYIFIFISSYISYYALSNNFNNASINKCIKWEFLNNDIITYLLYVMYILILYKMLTSDNKLLIIFALIYIITSIISINSYNCSPGLWCLYSALIAPLFVILNNLLE